MNKDNKHQRNEHSIEAMIAIMQAIAVFMFVLIVGQLMMQGEKCKKMRLGYVPQDDYDYIVLTGKKDPDLN